MNIEKYHNTGIGLSKKSLELLEKHMLILYKKSNYTLTNPMKIVEFGSGFSTQFLAEFKLHYNLNIIIDSFDNSKLYCYKNTNKYPFLNVNIRKLVSCSDQNYKTMFETKQYKSEYMVDYNQPTSYRQKNCFYKFQEGDLADKYDVMVLDGPNGNGRNFSYLHMYTRMKKGGLIFIDDIDHYDFEPKMNIFFNTKIIYKLLGDDKINKWTGGRIGLFEII